MRTGFVATALVVGAALGAPVYAASVLDGVDTSAIKGLVTETKELFFTDPTHGVVTTRRVGENLIRFSGGTQSTTMVPAGTIILTEPASSTWGFFEGSRRVVASVGTTGPTRTWGENWPILCIDNQMLAPRSESETVGCFVDTDRDGRFDVSVYPKYPKQHKMDRPAAYRVVTEAMTFSRVLDKTPSFAIEMIYQGISKGEARIAYREFKNDMARPAFNQDLTYELDPDGSTVIVFRQIKLKVIKATREEITYSVEQPMYPAQPKP